MQVRQVLIASILAATAAGAMSQEIDRSETLQAKSLAAQQEQTPPSDVQAADVVVVTAKAPDASWASRHAKHAYAKTWLHGDKRQPILVAAGPRV